MQHFWKAQTLRPSTSESAEFGYIQGEIQPNGRNETTWDHHPTLLLKIQHRGSSQA